MKETILLNLHWRIPELLEDFKLTLAYPRGGSVTGAGGTSALSLPLENTNSIICMHDL